MIFDIQNMRYIRGATLRFLQRLLVPICRSCVEHCHSYVHKNAVFATLAAELEATCKRIAFVFLAHCAMSNAVEWMLSVYEQISPLVELLQMSVIEVIRLDCKNNSAHRALYI